ncbi:hypothetical protein BD779DRAFT_139430 [Infundibulicybe gibba]|nr:hypothetical protein BD779DRAFT_139430 [Infundibulicybe gibba]
MIPLAEHIDRLAHHTKAIQETAYHIKRDYAGGPGPFTRAVLETHLGDLIRDVDPSELGLFDLITPVVNRPQEHDPRNAPHPEIARAEFPGATPLRKPPSRREDPHKAPEIEPEVYAKAALKYIDRYEFIRPMPRAYSQAALITEQLVIIRSKIQNLNETLKHAQAAEAPDMKSLADVEEQRVKELQEL